VLRSLDAQVKTAAADDPRILAAWNSAKRIGKGKVVPIEATVLPSTTPPAAAPTEVLHCIAPALITLRFSVGVGFSLSLCQHRLKMFNRC
jgi:hypothetical protein